MNTQTRKALTLVELLTVTVIIGMLAALSTVALTESMQMAREIKTQGTIQKLDAALLTIFESYEDRFENILGESNYTSGSLSTDNENRLKIHLIHDLMRMEMPQSWAEVFNSRNTISPKNLLGPISAQFTGSPGGTFQLSQSSAVQEYYYQEYRRYTGAKTRSGADSDADSAKSIKGPGDAGLFFLIIANLNPEALEGMGGNEIADTDGDGLLEFVDGWGKPIQFLRWAPAWIGSDRQPDVVTASRIRLVANAGQNIAAWGGGPNDRNRDTNADADLIVAWDNAKIRWSDPFDNYAIQNGWFLYPLIYSPGRDGIADVFSLRQAASGGPESPTVHQITANASVFDPFQEAFGMPYDAGGDGKLNHYDNIHNHRHAGGF